MKFRCFLSNYRTEIRIIGLLIMAYAASSLIMGCTAANFFSEAPGIINAVVGGMGALLTAISTLDPALGAIVAAVGVILNEVSAEATAVGQLVQEFKTTPDETGLQKFEEGVQLAITNMQKLLAPTGLPASVDTKIAQIAQVCLNEFEALAELAHSVKLTVTEGGATSPAAIHIASAKVAEIAPRILSGGELRSQINQILAAPTGDPQTDAAFAQVQPL